METNSNIVAWKDKHTMIQGSLYSRYFPLYKNTAESNGKSPLSRTNFMRPSFCKASA